MTAYQKRLLESTLIAKLKRFRAIALNGPRQAGKSTLLQNMLPHYTYITFDDDQMLSWFHHDPKDFMQRFNHHIIFDEAQKAPKLFHYVKQAIDQDNQSLGKFILSGSSQFLMLKQISESLAGRIGLLSLYPYSYQETPESLRPDAIFKGSYPEPINFNFEGNHDWYAAYIQTYLEKDVRMLHNIGNLGDFRRYLGLLAAHTSQEFNMSAYAKKLGVSVPTIKHWTTILEASYIVFTIQPYHNNLGKRITKRSKLYFVDTGLVAYLTKVHNRELYENGPLAGALFENYIVADLHKQRAYTTMPFDLYYLRTTNQDEIDLIIDHGTHQDLCEIKSSHTFKPKMLSTLKRFQQDNQDIYLIYQGETQPSQQHSHIVNYTTFLETNRLSPEP